VERQGGVEGARWKDLPFDHPAWAGDPSPVTGGDGAPKRVLITGIGLPGPMMDDCRTNPVDGSSNVLAIPVPRPMISDEDGPTRK